MDPCVTRPMDARAWAALLLHDLGADSTVLPERANTHPALRWAECGAMALTGRRDGPPLMCPVPLASCADGALFALGAIAGVPDGILPEGAGLLAERAALAGYERNGRIAAGGSCRLLDCADGRIALSLARAHDWTALPALLGDRWHVADEAHPGESGSSTGPADAVSTEAAWRAVAAAVAEEPCHALVERGRLLSLAITADRLPAGPSPGWYAIDCEHPATGTASRDRPRVLDLSALWAGPLCTHLLGLLGADVLKVESTTRPDGARAGNAAFYDQLNRGKSGVELDLGTQRGRDQLRGLLDRADIVVEASRPRALEQLGIHAGEYCAAGRSITWIRLTAHGHEAPEGDWIGFGDDAGVASGLASLMQYAAGEPVFCGDAIADPLAGMHAAVAAWWSHRHGGARRISLSLAGVVRHCVAASGSLEPACVRERQAHWNAVLREAGGSISRPAPRARTSAVASGTSGFVYHPGESRPA